MSRSSLDTLLRGTIKANLIHHLAHTGGKAIIMRIGSASQGGIPNFNPVGLATRSHAEYVEAARIQDMIREDLIAERIAIETYSEIVRWLDSNDPTTRRLMERILEVEEHHAEDLKNLLEKLNK